MIGDLEQVAARRPRGVVSPTEIRDALDAFQRAAETGDLQSLLDILAPDVVFLGDGGGVKQAVLRPIVRADKVARLLATAWAGSPPRRRCSRHRSMATRR